MKQKPDDFGPRRTAVSEVQIDKKVTVSEALTYAAIFSSPLMAYRFDIFGANLSLQRLFVATAILFWLLSHLLRKKMPRLPGLGALLAVGSLVLLILYEVVQLPMSKQPSYAFSFIGSLVAGLIVVSAMWLILDNEKKFRRAIWAFLFSSFIPLLLGLFQAFAASFGLKPTLPLSQFLALGDQFLGVFATIIYGETVPRIASTLTAPAYYGEYLVFVALILLSILVYSVRDRALTMFSGSLLSLVGFSLLATVARSAWLLMALGLFLFTFHFRRELLSFLLERSSWLTISGIAVAVSALVLLTAFPLGAVFTASMGSLGWNPQPQPTPSAKPDSERAAPVPSDEDWLKQSTGEHQQLRLDALELFVEHPLFGVGIGNYGVETGQEEGVSSSQCTLFTFLAEGGLLGATLLLIFMGTILLLARQTYLRCRHDCNLQPLLLGLYVSSFVLVFNNLLLYDTLFRDTSWVLVGLVLVAARATSIGRNKHIFGE